MPLPVHHVPRSVVRVQLLQVGVLLHAVDSCYVIHNVIPHALPQVQLGAAIGYDAIVEHATAEDSSMKLI